MGTFVRKQREREVTNVNIARKQKDISGTPIDIDDAYARASAEAAAALEAAETAQETANAAMLRASHPHPYAGANHHHNETYSIRGHSHDSADLPDRTGTTSGHSHSLSSTFFIKQTKKQRWSQLADRYELEILLAQNSLSRAERVIAKNTLNVLKLLQDYRELNAFERERRFLDPAWAVWTHDYKKVYGVDEYAEEDRENFLAYGCVRMDPYSGIAEVRRKAS